MTAKDGLVKRKSISRIICGGVCATCDLSVPLNAEQKLQRYNHVRRRLLAASECK